MRCAGGKFYFIAASAWQAFDDPPDAAGKTETAVNEAPAAEGVDRRECETMTDYHMELDPLSRR
ncbi:MAG: hypothetical protein M0Z56_06695 [Desulfobacteraceae bacterium]|nr:hypothetical protein [Desulfobacteraceae bacterium]